MSNLPKTIFCDIDGTLILHDWDNHINQPQVTMLDGTMDKLKEWDKLGYRIILTTGRKESTRKITEEQLRNAGIIYDQLVMGLSGASRVLINDKKPNGVGNTAFAINIERNSGIKNINLETKYVTTDKDYKLGKIEKPWGYENLIEINDNYVMKELFMKKGHKCSLQYHVLKRETAYILKGKMKLYIGDTEDSIEEVIMNPGDHITLEPYKIHRMEALEDSLYFECSSNQLYDVVRLQDSYGRK